MAATIGMINYARFRLSLARLQEQYANYRQLDPSLSEITQDAVAESVLRRFKTCYDCMWKTLKRYLVEELGSPMLPTAPNRSSGSRSRTTCLPARWSDG